MEVEVDGGEDGGGLAVEEVGFVGPLQDSVGGGFAEVFRARHGFGFFDGAVRGDGYGEDHGADHAAGCGWDDGVDLVEQHAGHDIAGDAGGFALGGGGGLLGWGVALLGLGGEEGGEEEGCGGEVEETGGRLHGEPLYQVGLGWGCGLFTSHP